MFEKRDKRKEEGVGEGWEAQTNDYQPVQEGRTRRQYLNLCWQEMLGHMATKGKANSLSLSSSEPSLQMLPNA